eukprot:scaffold27940_cov77-Phaeocystis_antarctica.AAC.1
MVESSGIGEIRQAGRLEHYPETQGGCAKAGWPSGAVGGRMGGCEPGPVDPAAVQRVGTGRSWSD